MCKHLIGWNPKKRDKGGNAFGRLFSLISYTIWEVIGTLQGLVGLLENNVQMDIKSQNPQRIWYHRAHSFQLVCMPLNLGTTG
uniref:Uncharacterized protein n=1 Tax=Arundo donax TaxID=35708 RepID=A0A0A9BYJ0_ARUDO